MIATVYNKAALDTAEVEVITVDATYPDWNSPSIVEQAARITPSLVKRSLSDLNTDLELKEPVNDFTFKIAPNPFTEGSDYFVYHASDLVNFRKIVLKHFKQPGLNQLEPYMKVLEVHTISTIYAHEFNVEPENEWSINFTHLDIIISDGNSYYTLEPFLAGKIERFNDMSGEVISSPHADFVHAFSHYTWVKSEKTLLICDLQGCKMARRNKIVLTDPVIHSNGGGKYGAGDCGMEGVEKFFSTHTCSAICERMNLAGQTV